jgi:hypothetical protein
MVDVTAGQGVGTGSSFSLAEIGSILKRGDIASLSASSPSWWC